MRYSYFRQFSILEFFMIISKVAGPGLYEYYKGEIFQSASPGLYLTPFSMTETL